MRISDWSSDVCSSDLDLSLEEVPVDASGNILFPLIGQVSVSGKTSTELSNAIAERLGERYLVDPQVSTIVSTSASQNVTVEGAVNKPGVFPLQGDRKSTRLNSSH